MTHVVLTEQKDWVTLARNILEILPQKDTASVIALNGELGAGKTTFVQALAGELGIGEYVTSPTFIIMKSYVLPEQVQQDVQFKRLVHIDAYRIEDMHELDILRLDELYADPYTLICIEWAGRIEERMPSDRLEVDIEYDPKTGARSIEYGHTR